MLAIPLIAAAIASGASLDEAYQAALKRSESLSAREKQVLIAEERYAQAKGSILPNVSGNASYLVQDRSSDPLAQAFFPRTQPEVKLSLTQPIFRGLRELATLRQYGLLRRAETHARDRARQLLYNDVAHGYHAVLAYEQDIKNIENQLKLYDDRIGELSQRVRAGTSSETDLISLQASRSTVNSQLESAKASLASARESFVFLTGLARDTELAPVEGAQPRPAQVGAYLATLERRPDILDAAERSEAAGEGVGIAKGAHFPTVDLRGNYYFKRQSDVYKGIDWDVQGTLTFPIFAGGTIQSQVRESVLTREQYDLELSRRRRQAEQEVRSLHGNYLAGLESIAALEKSLELSEKNYQLLRRDYRRGLTRNLDVLQALVAAEVARRELLRARYSARDTWVQLQTASGKAWASKDE
jgi:outer membrane protein